jgi:hypothetical protein
MDSRILLSTVLFLALLAGCSQGPRLGEVEGLVTLNGQPLPGAEIEFKPDVGRSSFAVSDAQGRYRLQFARDRHGALPGNHTVKIRAGDRDDARGSGPAVEFPAEYNEDSTLTRKVVAGSNVHDFHLEMPAGAVAGGQGDGRAVR